MDKIYSRRRFRLPVISRLNFNNGKGSKRPKILIIIIIAAITFYVIAGAVNPIFAEVSAIKARNLATEIIHNETNNVLARHDYNNFISPAGEGTSGNVLTIDVATINQISTEITLAVESRFQNLRDQVVEIPLGAFTGNTLVSGMGPNIGIRVISRGNVRTEIRSEFESRGINQTIYRIYLLITGEIRVFTPYNAVDEQVAQQVLLVETVIVGDVPEMYLNMDRELNNLRSR